MRYKISGQNSPEAEIDKSYMSLPYNDVIIEKSITDLLTDSNQNIDFTQTDWGNRRNYFPDNITLILTTNTVSQLNFMCLVQEITPTQTLDIYGIQIPTKIDTIIEVTDGNFVYANVYPVPRVQIDFDSTYRIIIYNGSAIQNSRSSSVTFTTVTTVIHGMIS